MCTQEQNTESTVYGGTDMPWTMSCNTKFFHYWTTMRPTRITPLRRESPYQPPYICSMFSTYFVHSSAYELHNLRPPVDLGMMLAGSRSRRRTVTPAPAPGFPLMLVIGQSLLHHQNPGARREHSVWHGFRNQPSTPQ